MSDAEELSRLATALAAHVRRRARSGVRRTPLPQAPARPAEPAPAGSEPASAPSTPPAAEKAARSTSPPHPDELRARAAACPDLSSLRELVAGCTACGLCETRTQTVFQDGSGSRRVLFVGEAPGADEDRQGVPFVGRAGQLLTDILTKGMGLTREEVAIANVLKCRPPDNRDPSEAEKRTCTPYLDRQIELLDPQVIIPLGRHAANHVLGTDLSMGRMRGRVHEVGGRKVVPTYHPAYLLRSPGMKKECWKDIQLAMELLDLPGPRSN